MTFLDYEKHQHVDASTTVNAARCMLEDPQLTSLQPCLVRRGLAPSVPDGF